MTKKMNIETNKYYEIEDFAKFHAKENSLVLISIYDEYSPGINQTNCQPS